MAQPKSDPPADAGALVAALTDSAFGQLQALLAPLGRAKQASLLRIVEQGRLESANSERIASILTDLLKGKRTAHARRAWTAWFDPVLQRDHESLAAPTRLPGYLHITDVGGWWLALSARMGETVGRLQAALEQETRTASIDEVLASPAGERIAEELRQRSLQIVKATARKPPERAALLQDANRGRERIAQDRGETIPAALGPDDLSTLETILETVPLWKVVAPTGLRADFDKALHDARSFTSEQGMVPVGVTLLAIAHLHRSRRPDHLLQLDSVMPASAMEDYALAYLDFSAKRLENTAREELMGRPSDRRKVPRGHAQGAINEFFSWYDCGTTLGVGGDSRSALRQRAVVGGIQSFFGDEVVPAVNRRITTLSPLSSLDEVSTIIGAINQFNRALLKRGLATAASPWSNAAQQQVFDLFTKTIEESPEDGILRISKLHLVGQQMGFDLEVSTLNQKLLRLAEVAFTTERDFTKSEETFLRALLTAAVREKRQSRWWVTAELDSMLKAAEQTAFGAKVIASVPGKSG